MKKKYRIVPNKVTKNYAVECWRWYFPFWTQVAFWRGFETIDEAKLFVEQTRNPVYH